MEEGGVANDVHIGVLRDKPAQPLHGVFVGLGLAHVEGNLVFEVLPVVGHRVVHVDGVPDQVGQEAHGVVVILLHVLDDHAAGIFVIVPVGGVHDLAAGPVDDLPPALDVVPGVDFHQLVADALHQGDGQGVLHGGVEPGHDVALLHLVGVGLGPGVVLTGGVVGGVHLGVHTLEGLGVIGAVAVTDGVRAPTLEYLQGLGHHVHVSGDGYPP